MGDEHARPRVSPSKPSGATPAKPTRASEARLSRPPHHVIIDAPGDESAPFDWDALNLGQWQPDILGPGYEKRVLPLLPDDEGPVITTLVRYRPLASRQTTRVVLYIHGWSDYFFQTGLAEFWAEQDAAFYAIDLRKYGRSLLAHQTPCYIADLAEYDADIAAAMKVIEREEGADKPVIIMAHSTGGLIASLWAHRHPDVIAGLILNSPWLELQGSSLVRTISGPGIRRLASLSPLATLPNVDAGFYSRTINEREDGHWPINEEWRPARSFPVRAGWLRAILDGHATVAGGLDITCPVVALIAQKSLFAARWHEEMRTSDIVLDVEPLVQRAARLGKVVTIIRIEDGMHDLALSILPARARFYFEVARWTEAYTTPL